MRRVILFVLTIIALFTVVRYAQSSPWLGTPEPVRIYAEKKAKSASSEKMQVFVAHVRNVGESFADKGVLRKVTYMVEYADAYDKLVASEKVFVTFKLVADNYDQVVQFSHFDTQARKLETERFD
jgi:hypothetical protein